jgi:tRNA-dihydrouridine synthase
MGVLQSRKIAAWYFKGYPNVAYLRNQINRATSLKEMVRLIETFKGETVRLD